MIQVCNKLYIVRTEVGLLKSQIGKQLLTQLISHTGFLVTNDSQHFLIVYRENQTIELTKIDKINKIDNQSFIFEDQTWTFKSPGMEIQQNARQISQLITDMMTIDKDFRVQNNSSHVSSEALQFQLGLISENELRYKDIVMRKVLLYRAKSNSLR